MNRDFAEAYDDCLPRVYAFFAYRLGSREDAEDLTQATFERAFRAWGRYDSRRASVTTWLLAIARNTLIDHARAARASPAVTSWEGVAEPHTGDASPSGGGPDAEILFALSALSTRDREVIALRFGAELTNAEIAALMRLSLANVQQITSRGLRRMRAVLESPGQEANGPTPRGPSAATKSRTDPETP